MTNFSKKMGEFTAELRKQKASDPNVAGLNALLPSLTQLAIKNKASGKITGNVTQAGSVGASSWDAATAFVAAIGSNELSKRFHKLLEAATENASVSNEVAGEVTGNVFQFGDVKGDINW